VKQLVPTGLDEYLAEHKEGDTVTGRLVEMSGGTARVELGGGVMAMCRIPRDRADKEGRDAVMATSTKTDISSLGSMLQARWKSGPAADEAKPEAMRAGQIRKFKIAKLDVATKKIELELV